MPAPSTDIAIVGGGLAGSLVALALASRRPEVRVSLIEQGARLGGEHIWSFFESDVGEGAELLEPLVAARWDGYEVRFPAHRRQLGTCYRSITSGRLDEVVRRALPQDRVLTGRIVASLGPSAVTLEDGSVIEAGAVIDARGLHGMPHMRGGWQKFLGRMLTTATPHGLARPIVMDATVRQVDGYRFVYALPFSPTQVFLEDTYYSDTPDLDVPALRGRLDAYAAAQGWHVARVDYEETGVLPVIGKGDFARFWAETGENGTGRAGARAALVHPLTSYSLPFALQLAIGISALDNLSPQSLGECCHAWALQHWRQGRFYRMLTRMLFEASSPARRYTILERFYRLPEPLIERFYAGRSTRADMMRILCGKPPVPLGRAISSLLGSGSGLASLELPR